MELLNPDADKLHVSKRDLENLSCEESKLKASLKYNDFSEQSNLSKRNTSNAHERSHKSIDKNSLRKADSMGSHVFKHDKNPTISSLASDIQIKQIIPKETHSLAHIPKIPKVGHDSEHTIHDKNSIAEDNKRNIS